MVAPLDQILPVVLDDVKTTELPEQKVVGPLKFIIGVVPVELIVTVIVSDVATQLPFATVTE